MKRLYFSPQVKVFPVELRTFCITGSDGTGQILDDGGNTSDLGDDDIIIDAKQRDFEYEW